MCVACPAIWYENLPNVILESFAYGKPVIASRLGSLADAVEDGKTGLLFEPKNPFEIASCIRRLYEDSHLCVELGENARQEAETKYSPQAHWSRFMEIYNGIKNAKT
jgi:glycosyltransferase involved in cell wall biosynthesis